MASVKGVAARTAVTISSIIFAGFAITGSAETAIANLTVSATVPAYCTFNQPEGKRTRTIDANCSTPPTSIDFRYLNSADMVAMQREFPSTFQPSAIRYENLPQAQDGNADILMVTVIY